MRLTARWPVPDIVRIAAVLIAATLAASAQPGPLAAQSAGTPPCVLDKCLNGTVAAPQSEAPGPDGAGVSPPTPATTRMPRTAPGSFDFYVLALSWSPGFCATGGSAKAPRQCAAGARLGFVVHGLWPQNQHGYPSDCDRQAQTPSRLALASVQGLYPDDGLARYEWRKHGTCTGLSPTDYFGNVRAAHDAITIPQAFQSPDAAARWAPLDVARAFVAANPRLRTDSMAVTCRDDVLAEVRICFAKDLRGFVSCPEVARSSCRRPVAVPPLQ